MKPVFLEDETAMEAFGATLADFMDTGGLVTLSGDLGAGKTTLVRGFMHAIGHKGAVKSPTYTLVEPYDINGRSVMHFDLYRLSTPEELEYLGFRDYLDGSTLCLIEWPEKAKGFLPEPDLAISIGVVKNGRQICWQSFSEKGALVDQHLSANLPS
ncbi:tRNA (adenosine(37)-N6)-threonylcarbamoyltransferase complex ATPase subunit type 1 TsaE [Haliea sp. AH-315-K21]|uniref:tRNA threonylcarbamoyladenosine biosynthesis protein TsaE n=1 Tax=SAR86 cluster bacterium TaxID=2030880 RepID=A0A2A5C913_9GAMM|nr:tRNA (adenosine(37)-N6)-threonylcarbamoyltransferase complex ATPase subunit type 1 TsaE [Haliea sp. AH-315-K21]MBN4075438.1 tRNA (adenosine(37)-N6)-threonylcarbamoyltransferase complex ATPase subunit type 1 TsaE [Gammaproteobacteria bacterium AH-315-E17]PCJ40253.1 MAG: tRNA (adenosine(37)-N6)-threonylcarbamoyltransferase complex ATPase subunit type 1 TsaE [SAR86 cluster bacterium]